MTYLTTGPLARRAEDLAPLLRILAGAEAAARIGDPASVDLAALEVVVVEGDGRTRVSDDLARCQRAAADALAARGARVRTARVKASRARSRSGPRCSTRPAALVRVDPRSGTEVRGAPELVRFLLGRSPYTLPSLALVLFEKLPKLLPAQGRRFVEAGKALRSEVVELLGPHG